MTEAPVTTAAPSPESLMPGVAVPDTRAGYSGVVGPADQLLDFARALRDQHGYDYLSSVTGVDYFPENNLEVVYHVYRTSGGAGLGFKTQLPREDPVAPSLFPIYPGVEFQEREAWDLLGIRFSGHPDLRRILMWEGFAGHPLRKDWREAYFEEEGKPFKNRWPEGNVYRIEDKVPFEDNLVYPPDFDPESWTPETDAALYAGLAKVENPGGNGHAMDTDTLVEPGPAAPLDPRRVSGRPVARRGNDRRPQAGDGLPAPQSREDRRAQHLLDEHALHRSAGLFLFDGQQLRLRAGGREVDEHQAAGAGRVHPRHHGRVDTHRQPPGDDRLPAQRPGGVLHPDHLRLRRARADPGRVRSRLRFAHDVQLLPLRRAGTRPATGSPGQVPRPGDRAPAAAHRRDRRLPDEQRDCAHALDRGRGADARPGDCPVGRPAGAAGAWRGFVWP